MAYNHIGDYGLEILAEYLKTRPELLGLNIAGNAITDIGARYALCLVCHGLVRDKVTLIVTIKNVVEALSYLMNHSGSLENKEDYYKTSFN